MVNTRLSLKYTNLSVVVEGHGHHVEGDEHHDDHVKLLVRDDAEHDGLRLPLRVGGD